MQDPVDCWVFEENWPAVQIFLFCQTQWRAGAFGMIGLDYTVVRWAMELQQVADHLDCLRRLQVIESEVVASMQQGRVSGD